jgi:catalase
MPKSEFAPIPYVDSVETPPDNEPVNIQRSVQALEAILSRGLGEVDYLHGHIHRKSHGHVRGEFRTIPNLPPELAQGVFAKVQTFQAMARFSNSASRSQSDYIPDGRGMAIKLLDVEGPRIFSEADEIGTQDFVMINHPVFFARNVEDFLRLEEVLTATKGNKLEKMQQAFTGGDWNPLNWHWRATVNALQTASHLPAHPASNTYFSMTPIRFGQYVAKYRAKPAGDLGINIVDTVSKLGNQSDAMRLMLQETLKTQQILFEFQVQLRTSERTMPVEDATVEWPENQSPYRTVALFLIPRQDLLAEFGQAAPRSCSFNVWHAIEDHRPLGGINRLRRKVYPIAAAWRVKEGTAEKPPA